MLGNNTRLIIAWICCFSFWMQPVAVANKYELHPVGHSFDMQLFSLLCLANQSILELETELAQFKDSEIPLNRRRLFHHRVTRGSTTSNEFFPEKAAEAYRFVRAHMPKQWQAESKDVLGGQPLFPGRVYAGVGTERLFQPFASMGEGDDITHLLMFDRDWAVVAYNALNIFLIAIARDIADYRYLRLIATLTDWRERLMGDYENPYLNSIIGERLYAFWAIVQTYDPYPEHAVEEPDSLAVQFSHDQRFRLREALLHRNPGEVFPWSKRANYLYCEEAFNRLQQAARAGRLHVLNATLFTQQGNHRLKRALKVLQKIYGVTLGAIDLSTIVKLNALTHFLSFGNVKSGTHLEGYVTMPHFFKWLHKLVRRVPGDVVYLGQSNDDRLFDVSLKCRFGIREQATYFPQALPLRGLVLHSIEPGIAWKYNLKDFLNLSLNVSERTLDAIWPNNTAPIFYLTKVQLPDGTFERYGEGSITTSGSNERILPVWTISRADAMESVLQAWFLDKRHFDQLGSLLEYQEAFIARCERAKTAYAAYYEVHLNEETSRAMEKAALMKWPDDDDFDPDDIASDEERDSGEDLQGPPVASGEGGPFQNTTTTNVDPGARSSSPRATSALWGGVVSK